MKRSATAVWQGSGKEGSGNVSTESHALEKTQYSFGTRFEDGVGSNPEELIAAAHSGCFSMKLSFNIDAAGYTAENIETKCEINFISGTIAGSHLIVRAKIPGISEEKFQEVAKDAEENCPISKLLNAPITMDAKLV